jgi:hypothetical protein
MPSTIKVRVIEASNLPVMDRRSKLADPYVQVEFGDSTRETRVRSKTLNPVWNEDFRWEVSNDVTLQGAYSLSLPFFHARSTWQPSASSPSPPFFRASRRPHARAPATSKQQRQTLDVHLIDALPQVTHLTLHLIHCTNQNRHSFEQQTTHSPLTPTHTTQNNQHMNARRRAPGADRVRQGSVLGG